MVFVTAQEDLIMSIGAEGQENFLRFFYPSVRTIQYKYIHGFTYVGKTETNNEKTGRVSKEEISKTSE